MIDSIRLRKKTDHGGRVISASEDTEFGGRQIARKGDEVACPPHDVKPKLIIEGDETTPDAVLTIARHRHLAMCSFRPLSSLL